MKTGLAFVALLSTACASATAPPTRERPSAPVAAERSRCDQEFLGLQFVVRDGRVGQIPLEEFRETYVRQCLLVHELEAFVEERRGCSLAADCTRIATSCPFGSQVSVAARYRDAVIEKHRELLAEYARFSTCKYKSALPLEPACVEGQCAFLPP